MCEQEKTAALEQKVLALEVIVHKLQASLELYEVLSQADAEIQDSLLRMISILSERQRWLYSRLDELTPKNEFGLTEEQTYWVGLFCFHAGTKHKDCPALSGEPCEWYDSEWKSWDWRDYTDRFLAVERRVKRIVELIGLDNLKQYRVGVFSADTRGRRSKGEDFEI